MFCASNDSTLVWYRLACSEKTSPDENINFPSKSWDTHSQKVNTIHWTETHKWYFYDVLRFKWHHTRLISTSLFREDLSRRKQQFLVKIMKYTFTQSKRNTLNWYPWMVLLRCSALPMTPHSSDIDSPVPRRPLPTKTAILVKIMKYTFTQSKRNTLNWDH